MPKQIEEQEIRERAYALWQEAGSPGGQEDDFWNQAKAELTKEGGTIDIDQAGEESFPASDAVNHM